MSSTEQRRDGEARELFGLRVADFTTVMAGPYCTRLLSDRGAEVVKVESRDGDSVRHATPLRDGHSAYYAQLNTGKRSVGLDLRSEGGRRAARALIDGSDVVVENFRPGVMARFGLDYDTVGRRRPDIVYCSVSGYGQTGPWADRPAVAQAVHAVSGFDTSLLRYQTTPMAPLSGGMFVADALAGALAFGGVLAALRARDSTGVGRHVDIALLDGVLSLMAYEVANAQFPQGYDRKGYPPARTRDGYVMVAAVNDRAFAALARVIGAPELVDDPRFCTTQARWEHTTDFLGLLEAWTGARTAAEVERLMLEAGVPASQYWTVEEQMESAQARHRGTFALAEDDAGQVRVVVPMHLRGPDEAPGGSAPVARRVAQRGADTREVLTNLLGEEDAEELIGRGDAFEARRDMLADNGGTR